MKEIIAQLATELDDAGVTPEAIRKWRERGKVPHRHRLPLLDLAKRKRAPLTVRDFEFPKSSEAA